ncbi:Uncharacterized protein TPS_08745 [Trichinella pseudospiralis]
MGKKNYQITFTFKFRRTKKANRRAAFQFQPVQGIAYASGCYMVTLWKQFEAKMSALLPMPRCVSRDSPELCQAVGEFLNK